MNIENLVAATYAPMHKDGSVNIEIIPSYQNYLKINGVNGAFINGSTGDFTSLTVEERKMIIDAWADCREENFTLMNHVGHTSADVVKDLVGHSIGKVDAIGLLPPFYFTFSTITKLVEYCKEIAGHAPQVPLYYYHIPSLSKTDFSMIDFIKLAIEEIPNFAGLKFTNNNLIDFRYCKGHDKSKIDVLFGVDELFLASLSLGASGWVGSTYNHIAPLYWAIRKAFETGDLELANQLQTKAMGFVDILKKYGFIGASKSFMKIIGLDLGPSRHPHSTLSDEELKTVVENLRMTGIIDFIGKETK